MGRIKIIFKLIGEINMIDKDNNSIMIDEV